MTEIETRIAVDEMTWDCVECALSDHGYELDYEATVMKYEDENDSECVSPELVDVMFAMSDEGHHDVKIISGMMVIGPAYRRNGP